mgnify:FL=1
MLTFILIYVIFFIVSIIIIGIYNSLKISDYSGPISILFSLLSVLFVLSMIIYCIGYYVIRIPENILYFKFWNKNK